MCQTKTKDDFGTSIVGISTSNVSYFQSSRKRLSKCFSMHVNRTCVSVLKCVRLKDNDLIDGSSS